MEYHADYPWRLTVAINLTAAIVRSFTNTTASSATYQKATALSARTAR